MENRQDILILTANTFKPVKSFNAQTVSALEQYISSEKAGGRNVLIAQLIHKDAQFELTCEVAADNSVPEGNKDWSSWSNDHCLTYLMGKYSRKINKSGVDVTQLANRTTLDLIPEKRSELGKAIQALSFSLEHEVLDQGGPKELIEENLVSLLIKRAKKTAKCHTEDMRGKFLKEIEASQPKTLKELYTAILKAYNTYNDALAVISGYGMTVVSAKAGSSISDTEEEEKGENQKSFTKEKKSEGRSKATREKEPKGTTLPLATPAAEKATKLVARRAFYLGLNTQTLTQTGLLLLTNQKKEKRG